MAKANVQVGEVKVSEKTIEEQTQETIERSLEILKKNNEVTFSITDFGVGIAKNDLDKIFNSFYRSDVSNHPEIKGTGLGLSIVKRLCDLLNFKIIVESKQNERTQFRLFFPIS